MPSLPIAHPHLAALVARARAAATHARIGLVHPCDAAALEAAAGIREAGLGEPVLIGPRAEILRAAELAGVDAGAFEIVDGAPVAALGARRASALGQAGAVGALMKGSLHTDELMSAVVDKETGLRGSTRISHVFLFDLPRYPKLLGVADCVVNITPSLATKRDILGNAVALLRTIGVAEPKVGIVGAVGTVNPARQGTVDAEALVAMAREGAWPGAVVEGPFGFDNVISAEAARIKKMSSRVSGEADLLLVPDLNAGNMLYKSFTYIGGGECAGLVLGARVPIVLTSRADSALSRIASVALAVLAGAGAEPLSSAGSPPP